MENKTFVNYLPLQQIGINSWKNQLLLTFISKRRIYDQILRHGSSFSEKNQVFEGHVDRKSYLYNVSVFCRNCNNFVNFFQKLKN